MAPVPAPAAPIAQVGGGAPDALAPAPTVQDRRGPTATPGPPPWRSLSLTPSSSDESPAPAGAPASASARRSDKRKTVPELMGGALAKEQKEK
eukprot:7376404-Prymnesium_polylepis.1